MFSHLPLSLRDVAKATLRRLVFTNPSQPWNWTCSTQQQNNPRKRNWESTSLCGHATKVFENVRERKPWSWKEQNFVDVSGSYADGWIVGLSYNVIFLSILSYFRNSLRTFWKQTDFVFRTLYLVFIFKRSRFSTMKKRYLVIFSFWYEETMGNWMFVWRGVIREEISPTGTHNLRPLFSKCSVLFYNTTLYGILVLYLFEDEVSIG